MCNVCDAEHVLAQTRKGRPAVITWRLESASGGLMNRIDDPSLPVAAKIVLEAEGAPEGPGTVRFRRESDDEWHEVASSDVAGTLGWLGTDVRWQFVHDAVRAWLAGGPVDPVLARLAEAAHADDVSGRPVTRRSSSAARTRRSRVFARRMIAMLGPEWTAPKRPRGQSVTFRRADGVRLTAYAGGKRRGLDAILHDHGLILRGSVAHLRAVIAKLDRVKAEEVFDRVAAEFAYPPPAQEWTDIQLVIDPGGSE